ncbi:MAG: hypothetical protein WC139_01275 [Candidatus Kapaibacterium sp.]
MKKTTFLFLLFAAIFALNTSVKAQSYFTYDGSEFSVLLTCDDANTYVTAVQFSTGGKWVDFAIVDYSNLEDVEGGGFVYTCQDGKGVKFLVDYYRTQDYIKVTNLELGTEWTLYRRSE